MAVRNSSQTNKILNIYCPDNSNNKVYVNPNFSRNQKSNMSSSAIMHVNPNFSRLALNDEGNIRNKSKIYVNPKFINSKSVCDSNQLNSVNDYTILDRHSAVNTSESMMTDEQLMENKVLSLQVPITQSRYCLVRQNVANTGLNKTVPAAPKSTFKLNKYKSVPWTDIKMNPGIVKNVNNSSFASRIETNSNSIITKNIFRFSVTNRRENEFKFINYKNVSLMKQDKTKTKIYNETHKKVYKFNQAIQSKVKKTKVQLKKNNIPCPLFRKYGKCLRNIRGNCEFLHDKKHVSICRKFIKGLCHDKECVLSHDLTTKKMPTCYFYLQGTCTKTDCPYLHVKLNAKTKVCPDFLKGYCEKGSKCLQRHINVFIQKNKNNKIYRTPQEPTVALSNTANEIKTSRVRVNRYDISEKTVFQSTERNNENSFKLVEVKSKKDSDCRYYQEHREDSDGNELCEIIKPIRCKLGLLPSFIEL